MYQPFLNFDRYIDSLFQYVRNIEGQPGRSARSPSSPGGLSLPSSSMMPGSMPGIGLPMLPGRIGRAG